MTNGQRVTTEDLLEEARSGLDRLAPQQVPEEAVIVDIVPDCGPLGGIHAALTAARGDAVFVARVTCPS